MEFNQIQAENRDNISTDTVFGHCKTSFLQSFRPSIPHNWKIQFFDKDVKKNSQNDVHFQKKLQPQAKY